jgi:hypothetical protein
MLEHSKSLDLNDFLHEISPYVINLLHVQAPALLAPLPLAPPLANITEFRESNRNPDNIVEDTLPKEVPD